MINKILKSTSVVILIGILFTSCSPKAEYISAFYKQDVTNFESKLSAKGMLYDKNSGILYKISNNDKFLVADLQINSEVTQKKVLLFGLSMWIDETGKRKKNVGIKYPLGSKGFSKSSMQKMKEIRGNFTQKKVMLAEASHEIAIIGKNKEDIEVFDKRYKDGVKANISFDAFGMMHYQLKVPYEKIKMTYESLTLLNPSIGFETGKAEMQQSGQGGGMRPGGGGGQRRKQAGMNSGGTLGSNPEMQAMMKASSFWLKNIKFASVEDNK